MAQLAAITRKLGFHLEQVQDFTPTPMTTATEMWYTGYDPYTLEPVFSAKTPREKEAQRQYFFWYKDTPKNAHKPHQAHNPQRPPHDNPRTNPHPQKSGNEKRGRHRRH
jgi:radical SAM superfamily enzyme YgiQ (UPF0313 family)